MAGGRSFERGEDYFAAGRVGSLTEREGRIAAKVKGTRSYQVRLWIEDDDVDYSCTCPMGRDGDFCKHLVAVGLAWLDRGRTDGASGERSPDTAVTMDEVRAHLAGEDKSALVDMLMDQAMEDDRLRRRLFLRAAKADPKGRGVAACRRAIDEAVGCDDLVDYRSAYDYASGIEEAIAPIEELLDEGHASEVIDLAEYALEAVEEAVGRVDDSDGHMGGILERLQEVHLEACERARPDPEELAGRLFAWELRTDWDSFFGAAETYADILGEKGLAVYRELAEAEWAKVRALVPGRDDSEGHGRRFRITHIMETLARRTGDVEALVAVKKRDLSSAYDYLQIALAYREAGKDDPALEWAERGAESFPERTDPRLREFLADEYHRRGRHDEAMALVWAQFAESPALDAYRNLKGHADKVGEWKEWRSKALEFLRQSISGEKRARRGPPVSPLRPARWDWGRRGGHSELVRIFLWEEDVEAAWREASEGGCSEDLWMELAAKRERTHPEDALPIYRRRVEFVLERKNNEAYREAVGLLRRMRKLTARIGKEPDFARYLVTVRLNHKRKRNFMKLLDRERW
jgi:uncharacterized Zn finger protein